MYNGHKAVIPHTGTPASSEDRQLASQRVAVLAKIKAAASVNDHELVLALADELRTLSM